MNDLKRKLLLKNYALFFIVCLSFILNLNMKAQQIDLNGSWKLVHDVHGTITINNIGDVESWRECEIPHSWHIAFEDMMDTQGIVWYKKDFQIESKIMNKRYIIHFGAVDYSAQLFVNNEYVGSHEGGYTPFNFDISEFITQGNNRILLRVNDPEVDGGTEGIFYQNIPFGKQNWYVENSGIWQNVFINVRSMNFISSVKINTSNSGEISTYVLLDQKAGRDSEKLSLSILSPQGEKVCSIIKNVDLTEIEFKCKIDNPELWAPDHPNLYTINIEYEDDCFTDRFGFKELTAKNGKLFLNAEPFYMIGALDQNFYPETMYLIPSEEYVRDEMIKAKALGLNTLRCHIKIPDPLYLKTADEIGLIIWYEIPNWEILNENVMERCRKTIDEVLDRDWNHPSLSVISLINESWGIDLQNEKDRRWMKEEFNYLKSKAEGRLVVDNSACYGNFHIKSDINDYHTYWSIPDDYKNFSATISDVASRPDWLFSKFGDGEETGDEILMISEFGNWGLPKLPENLPFWFNRKFFDVNIVMPDGVHQRFADYKYGRFFKSYNDIAVESQRAQFRALKFEIEEIRLREDIRGYVITEFTDINWESNGLLDMWRNFKIYKNDLNLIQQQDLLIPRVDKFNYWAGDTTEIKLSLSHFSEFDLKGAKVKITIPEFDQTEFILSDIPQGTVKNFDSRIINLPAVEKPSSVKIKFELVDYMDQIISNNFIELFVFPKIKKEVYPIISIHPSIENQNLEEDLSKNGFNIVNMESPQQIIIANSIDESILSKMEEGVCIILEVDSSSNIPDYFPFKIETRFDNWYDGSWATNMNWINTNNDLFTEMNFGRTLGFEAADAMPRNVMTEIPAESFDDVLSGMYISWIHLNSGYIFQMKSGGSKILVTTFELSENYSSDPYSETMLGRMIDYILSEKCNPNITLN